MTDTLKNLNKFPEIGNAIIDNNQVSDNRGTSNVEQPTDSIKNKYKQATKKAAKIKAKKVAEKVAKMVAEKAAKDAIKKQHKKKHREFQKKFRHTLNSLKNFGIKLLKCLCKKMAPLFIAGISTGIVALFSKSSRERRCNVT